MICDDNRDENCQRRCSRREFLRTAGGIALALLLPGCRQGASPSVSVPTAGGWIETARYKKSPPWRLGRASRGDISSWQVMLSAHVEYGIKEKYGHYFEDYRCTSANWDANRQIQDIERLMAEGVDLLLIDPLDEPTIAAGVSRAMEAGIPVIWLCSAVQNAPRVSWLTTDEEERGTLCADWLAARVSPGRVVALLTEPAMGDSKLWLKGVRRLELRPGFTLDVVTSFWRPSDARKALAAALVKSATVQGLIVNSGTAGQGAIEALRERGMSIPPLAGGDDGNGWLRIAKQHSVPFLGFGGHARLGMRCVELAMDVLSGKSVPAYEEFPYQVFDETAIDRYYRSDLSDHFWGIHELPEPWIERMFNP